MKLATIKRLSEEYRANKLWKQNGISPRDYRNVPKLIAFVTTFGIGIIVHAIY